MAAETTEQRRASPAWALRGATVQGPAEGRAQAIIDDDGLGVGPRRIAWIDTDRVVVGDYRLELTLWPGGTLVLSELGRRFETFSAELAAARNRARVAGLLAHGIVPPSVFGGEWVHESGPERVEIQVYPTHVTIVPSSQDPWQIPLGAPIAIDGPESSPVVELSGAGVQIELHRLGRQRDAFIRAVTAARDLQAQTLANYTGRDLFADGHGVERAALEGFEFLLERSCSPERSDGARELLALSAGGEPRLGYAQLLDPEGDTVGARAPLPGHWASFLLVPVGGRVVLEILAGPSAATYVFEGEIAEINRDLQQLHFRRAQLALSEAQAEITPDNPHRLALRRLAPLQRLRAATRARLTHTGDWSGALRAAVTDVPVGRK
jgi:hypothetical protein